MGDIAALFVSETNCLQNVDKLAGSLETCYSLAAVVGRRRACELFLVTVNFENFLMLSRLFHMLSSVVCETFHDS